MSSQHSRWASFQQVRRLPWIVLALVTIATVFNYIDRMVLAALAQPVKQEFSLTDTQLGLLTGFAFAAFYAVLGIPIARLADVRSRRVVIGISVAVWSLATAACGLAQSYAQLFLARVIVAIGEAGCLPPALSILSDYYPPDRRGKAFGILYAGGTVGIILGFSIGGWAGANYGWRTAFVIIGLPGLLIAAAIFLLVAEPARVGATASPVSTREALRLLAVNSPYRWMVAGQIATSFILSGLSQWMPLFFIRSHGLGLAAAGAAFGLIVGSGMAIGMIVGGRLNDRFTRRSMWYPQYLGIWTSLCALPCLAISIWSSSVAVAFGAMFLAFAFVGVQTPVVLSAIQNVCDPRTRAMAAATAQMIGALSALGLGPTLIGILSDAFAPVAGQDGLRYALTATLLVPIAAIWIFHRAAQSMRHAELKKQETTELNEVRHLESSVLPAAS